jgi:hypothetical protein
MTTNRHTIRRPYRGKLTHTQEMELWLGPSHHGSAFRSRTELHQAWLKHRDRVMAAHAKWGRRPMAWWEFEAPFPRPSDRERSALFEAGLLGVEEREQLVAWWRRQFERAYEPLFFHCDGPGRVFSGAVGRQKHYGWADIPRSLLRQWSAEHRRRGKTIRKLEKAATEEPTPAA